MKRLICAIGLFLLACLALVACAVDSDVPDGMQSATAEGSLYRLYVPVTWNSNTETGLSSAYYFSTRTSSLTLTEPASDTGTASAFLDECLDELRARYGAQLKLQNRETGTLGDVTSETCTFDAWDGNGEYQVLFVAAVREDRHYLLTFAATNDLFDDCLDDVSKILQNFKFTDEPAPAPEKSKVLANAEAPAGMKTASADDVPYIFFVPETWQIDLSTRITAAYCSDTDRSNVSVTGYVPTEEVESFDAFYASTVKQYGNLLDDFTEVERQTDLTVAGKRAEVWEFTGSLGGVTYHYRQTVLVHNGFFDSCFYVLTYTALEENYAAHVEEVLSMQNALTFR